MSTTGKTAAKSHADIKDMSFERAMQMVIASALTAFASFVILMLNNVLTARSGWQQGFDVWYAFIRRSDILGTIILTAMVTIAFLYWQRDKERR